MGIHFEFQKLLIHFSLLVIFILQMKQNHSSREKSIFFLLAGFFSCSLVLISLFFFPGYKTEYGDQNFYLPPLFQRAVPDSYSRDFLMENSQTNASFFDEIVGITFFHNPKNIPIALFWWTTFSQFLFFFSITGIAFALSKNRFFSLLAPVFFLIGHEGFVCNALPADLWTFHFGIEFHARSLAISITTGALALFLLHQRFFAWIAISVCILLHFISALPILFFFICYTLFSDVWKKRYFWAGGYFLLPLFSIGVLLFFLKSVGGGEGMDLFVRVDSEWMSFLHERVWWIFSWDHFSSLPVLFTIYLPLFSLFLLCRTSSFFSQKVKGILNIFFVSLTFLMLFGLLFFDVFQLSIFGQLQLYRSSIWLRILFIIAALSVCISEILSNKRSRFEKIPYFFSFFCIPLGGTYFFVPFSLFAFFTILFFQIRETMLSKKYQQGIYWGVTISLSVLAFIYSAESHIQLYNLGSFLKNLLLDPLLSLGLFSFWMYRILPLCILLLLFFLWHQKKYPKHILPIIFCLAPIILLAFGFFFRESYQSFVASPLQNPGALGGWILEHVGNDDLIFTTQAAEPEAVHIRNRLGKSIFVTNTEGGQGAFQRAYALEWEHRRDIQSDFNQSWEELKNRYHITFVLAKVGEEVSEGEEVFSDGEYVVYRIGE